MAQTAVAVESLAERATYTDSVSFRVPTLSGYTYSLLLDGTRLPPGVTVTVTNADYHELFVTRTNLATSEVVNRRVPFIIVASDRGNPEKGLIPWIPFPPTPSASGEFRGATMRVTTPRDYPAGLPVPVVIWIEDEQGLARRVNGWARAAGFEASAIQVHRGVGSGFLPAATVPGALNYEPVLQSVRASQTIRIEPETQWANRSGSLSSSEVWPPHSRIHLVGDLTVPADKTLTIGAGSVVWLDPLVNITNTGRCLIEGSPEEPVIFTAAQVIVPEKPAGAWGGFVLRGSNAVLEAKQAIFAGGAGGTDWDFSPGSSHKSQQPVFFCHSNAVVRLTDCAVLNSAGQVGNGYNGDLILEHTLWQRAITGGEYVGGSVTVDRSAIIEFPNDDGVVNAAIADGDYDAIYFTTGTHVLSNSLFGFAKDDAIDSGSGGSGTVEVTNCWVESAQHEGLAWSGSGRLTETLDTVVLNCGQGLECGWSSSDNSPNCTAERLLSLGNSVGVRFGDNYDWDYWGLLRVTNSVVLNNYRDVWGLNWDNWLYGIYTPDGPFRMDIESNLLSQPNPFHPQNDQWNPARDATRLAPFMSTPAEAPVGVALAVRTNEFALPAALQGIPVRLSSFTTNSVSVGYSFLDAVGETLGSGALSFAPGETVQRIYPSGFDLSAYAEVALVLTQAVGGEITGQSNVVFRGSLPMTTVDCWIDGIQLPLERLRDGTFLRLDTPSAQAVIVRYRYESDNATLAEGSVRFAPGETVRSIVLPETATTLNAGLVRLQLSQPDHAILGAKDRAYYLPVAPPESSSLISKQSLWRYLDTGEDMGTAWRNVDFDDRKWASGPAQLGFGDNDEQTTLRPVGQNGQRSVTFYFRHRFEVAPPATFTNLAMWLLRDDGAVVYLNGTEVFRSPSLPPVPAPITYLTLANNQSASSAPPDNSIDLASLPASLLLPGANVLAVEVHQHDRDSSDISFDFELNREPAPVGAAPSLYASRFGNDVTMAWSDGTFRLQGAENIQGPWTTLTNGSPVDLPLAGSAGALRFFRIGK